ncbi:MAG: histidine kinase [Gilvibacter sp.]
MGTTEGSDIVGLILISVSLLLIMALALVAFFYFSRRKFVSAQLENAKMEIDHQKEMLQATILTQEEERKRIAQDMHDAISSKLNIVSLNTNVLLDGGVTAQESKQMLETILSISDTTLENSRRIAHDLLPPVLEKFGLWAGLEELKNDFNRASNGLIELNGGYEKCLEAKEELHVFRIVQELVNNSIRHGKATKINMTIACSPFALDYKDDGCGIDLTDKNKRVGLGMKNIQSRCDIIKATTELASQPGKGIHFIIKT